jgi:cytochrome b6-f complex iron-sulfur subunit
MERKDFIKTCGMVCLGGLAVTAFLEGCASASYFAQSSVSGDKITIKKTEFEQLENGKTIPRKFVLVKTEKYNFPICIYKTGTDEFSALLLECTHKGCELRPQGEYLVCPCHGSEFSNKGVVQNPPAEQNLQTFKTTTDNENIYLFL